MTIDEAIKTLENIVEECQRVIDTGIIFDNVTMDMLYCDDTEVIEEHLANYQRCAEEHGQLAEWLRELKFYKDRQDLINKSWQELINYKEGIEKIKMRSQAYRECGETVLASGMEQALDILREVNADEDSN